MATYFSATTYHIFVWGVAIQDITHILGVNSLALLQTTCITQLEVKRLPRRTIPNLVGSILSIKAKYMYQI